MQAKDGGQAVALAPSFVESGPDNTGGLRFSAKSGIHARVWFAEATAGEP